MYVFYLLCYFFYQNICRFEKFMYLCSVIKKQIVINNLKTKKNGKAKNYQKCIN